MRAVRLRPVFAVGAASASVSACCPGSTTTTATRQGRASSSRDGGVERLTRSVHLLDTAVHSPALTSLEIRTARCSHQLLPRSRQTPLAGGPPRQNNTHSIPASGGSKERDYCAQMSPSHRQAGDRLSILEALDAMEAACGIEGGSNLPSSSCSQRRTQSPHAPRRAPTSRTPLSLLDQASLSLRSAPASASQAVSGTRRDVHSFASKRGQNRRPFSTGAPRRKTALQDDQHAEKAAIDEVASRVATLKASKSRKAEQARLEASLDAYTYRSPVGGWQIPASTGPGRPPISAPARPPALAYTRSFDEAEELLQCIPLGTPLGFDLEWNFEWRSRASYKTSLLQVCTPGLIVIVQLSATKRLPPRLVELLEDKDTIKMGVCIQADCTKLLKDYGVRTNGILELSQLAKAVDGASWRDRKALIALKDLTRAYLGQRLIKDSTRTSDWTQELTERQIEYAASDCYVSLEILGKLCGLWERQQGLAAETVTATSSIFEHSTATGGVTQASVQGETTTATTKVQPSDGSEVTPIEISDDEDAESALDRASPAPSPSLSSSTSPSRETSGDVDTPPEGKSKAGRARKVAAAAEGKNSVSKGRSRSPANEKEPQTALNLISGLLRHMGDKEGTPEDRKLANSKAHLPHSKAR